MRQIYCSERVELIEEIPELHLQKGTVGTVRRTWHYPTVAYEVEFETAERDLQVLLLEDQVVTRNSD
jgi:Domain of unknown function (DUF4926)